MMLRIALLGVPNSRDSGGAERSPRGRRTWALLAYVLLADRPPSRTALAEVFHPEANDPLGALRWTLADLRKLVADTGTSVDGDPVSIEPGPGIEVDVLDLVALATSSGPLPGLLLERLAFRDAPRLESWLDLERHRLKAEIASVTREAAVTALAAGDDTAEAVRLAERLADIEPLDERHHALLIRALVAHGDSATARHRAGVATDMLSRELGTAETNLINAALDTAAAGEVSSPRAIDALVVAGRAAMGAGVPDAALRTLGTALSDARRSGDKKVLVNALLGLAEALSHGVRGLDEIALDLLYEAEAIAASTSDSQSLAVARREIGYIELLRGDYNGSDRWFKRALDAGPTSEDRLHIEAYRGSTLIDRGRFDDAQSILESVIEDARSAGYDQPLAYSLAMLGRLHLSRGEYASAVPLVEESIDVSNRAGWIAFRPFPEALYAQALLGLGRAGEGRELAEASFALACEVGDPCWEGISGHSLALADIDRGELDRAVERLEDSYRRATRLPDSWSWLNGYVLAALADLLVDIDPVLAEARLTELEAIALPSNMEDLSQRARALRERIESKGLAVT